MFSLLTLLFGCKDRSPKDWEPCTEELTTYTGPEESEFGFRMLANGSEVYITAPSNCTSPLYKLSNGELTAQSWTTDACARWGQEITLRDGSPVLFGPLSDTRWQNDVNNIELTSTNIRRLGTLPDGRLVQLFNNSVKIGGIEHPLPATSIDMARYDDDIAVLMRGIPTQVWTLNATFVFNETTNLLSRIHPFGPALTGKPQWVLGGGPDLLYTDGDTLYTVELPDWSRLKQDMVNHPHISMGYASKLMDLDNDGLLDWIVGAPTAGSGQNEGFPEQSGWVGWFEQRGRGWELQKEWTGASPFALFGWSVTIQQSDIQRSVLIGSPGASTVSQAACFQPVER